MSAVAVDLASPFKGLAAFADSDVDALFFFGREREREVLVANLLASRLTVLYGESGVGKTSLLAAGVVRELRERAPGAVVVLRDTWSGTVDDALAELSGAAEAYLILDQFEEYFLYHGENGDTGRLLLDLPELLYDSRVNVLISMREDSVARLDAFKARIPTVFANQLRLEHLDRSAARSAILGPIERWNTFTGASVSIEPELVEALLNEVAREDDRIEAPYLQLVLERIWNAEVEAGSPALRLATLQALGGAETIVRDHLQRALQALDETQQDVASRMFEHLVTPSGTKIALVVADLADYAHVPENRLRPVLDELTHERIVHSVDGSDRYEIFHDVLAEPIRAWWLQRRLEQERRTSKRRQRRLYVVIGVVLVALAIVAGLAVWAFAERGTVQEKARHAQARELEASALQQLDRNPNTGVKLALEAARLEPGGETEAVLRQSLVADRLRLVRHTAGPVRAVATSPRGDRIAVAVAGGHVLLLDAHNRRLVGTLDSPVPVAGLAFMTGGHRLVTVSAERLAQVWDTVSGRRLPHRGRLVGARAPDGTLQLVPLHGRLAKVITHVRDLVATSRGDILAARVAEPSGRVQPWLFTRRGRLLGVLPVRGVTDVEFSPDGRRLATALADGHTLLWDPRTRSKEQRFRDARSGVDVISFSPDGRLLASGAEDGGVRIWDIASGERLYYLFGHTNPVSSVAWSPNGNVVAAGSPDHTVLLWRMHGPGGGGELVGTLAGSRGAVRALAFTPDSARLVTGGDESAVRVWNARPDETLVPLGSGPGPALGALWGGHTIVGRWSDVVKTFDASTRRQTHALTDVGHDFRSLAVAGNGELVAAGTDGTTVVWNAATGKRLFAGKSTAPVGAVAISGDGRLVADGAQDGTVQVWGRDGSLRWTHREVGPVAGLSFDPADDELVTAGREGADVWSVGAGRRLHHLASPGGVVDALFSPDGTLVAAGGRDGKARLWFARTGNLYRVLRRQRGSVTDVAFSPDGRLLAASGTDADVRIWGVHTGLGYALQRSAFGPVSGVSFDSTSRWVAGAAPVSVVLWSAAAGQRLFYLRGHTALLTSVAFAPFGPTVVSSSRDGTLRTYTCDVCVDLTTLAHLASVRMAQTR